MLIANKLRLLLLYFHWDSLGRRDFFFLSCPLYFFPYSRFPFSFFACFFILFHSCCSLVQVFGKTLLYELPISNSHTVWCLFFFRLCNYKCTMNQMRYGRNTETLVNLSNKLNEPTFFEMLPFISLHPYFCVSFHSCCSHA